MSALPPLPYPEWEQTRETLHLWAQIVLQSAYEAGAAAAGWSRDELVSSWWPPPP